MTQTTKFTSHILAAGDGKRMKSQLAKPLHEVGGKPMLGWVIDTAMTAGSDKVSVVTSPSMTKSKIFLASRYESVTTVKQSEPLAQAMRHKQLLPRLERLTSLY